MKFIKPNILLLTLLLNTMLSFGQEQYVTVTGQLLDKDGHTISGDIFLDTLIRKINLIGGYQNPPMKLLEKDNIYISVKSDGSYTMKFDGVIPHYIYFTSPGKRYTSIFFPQTKKGKINMRAILFDEFPARNESVSSIITNDSLINQYIKVYTMSNFNANTEVKNYMDSSVKWRMEKGTKEGFNYDLSGYYNKMLDIYRTTADRGVKNYILLNLSFLCIGEKYPVEEKYLIEAIQKVPSTDYLWAADLSFLNGIYNGLGGMKKNKEILESFVDSLSEYSPSPLVGASIIFHATYNTYNLSLPEFKKYYEKLLSKYSNSVQAEQAVKIFGPQLKIVKGVQLPEFEIINIDTTRTITKESLKDKIWLIDFWATWCGPCIAQFPYIQKVYDKYKDRGLGVFSISVDKEISSVQSFRNKRWKMPWLNGFAGNQKTLTDRFEVFGIPKMILVDKDGKILSVSRSELEGDELEKTIAQYLEN